MAVFVNKSKFSPEDLKYVNRYEVPILNLSEIEQASKTEKSILEDEMDTAKANFEKFTEIEDKLLGIKFDTVPQLAKFEKLKESVGLTPQTFSTLDVNSLKSPFEVRGIGSRLTKLMANPEFVDLQRQKLLGEKFRENIPSIKSPKLRDRAILQHQQYIDGNIDPTKLNVKDYETVDVRKEIFDAAKLIPEISDADFYKSPSGDLEGVKKTKQRSIDAVNKIIAQTIKTDGAFRENLIAEGFLNDDGSETDLFVEYKNSVVDELTKPNVDITDVKETGDNKGSSPSGRTGRFSDSSEKERRANNLDTDITNAGYELPDMSTVSNAADAAGVLVVGADGKAYIQLYNTKDNKPLTGESGKVWLKKAAGKKAYSSVINTFTGGAFDDISNIVSEIESNTTGGYNAYNPSIETGAVGKYQFIYTWHKDKMKKALDDLDIDYTKNTINPEIKTKGGGKIASEKARIMSAFLESPQAQELAWKEQYSNLYRDAHELAEAGYGTDLSIAELIYLLHHEGSVKAVKKLLDSGVSEHDTKGNPSSTYENNNSLRKIRNILNAAGYSGEINENGSMQRIGNNQNTAEPIKSTNLMDL